MLSRKSLIRLVLLIVFTVFFGEAMVGFLLFFYRPIPIYMEAFFDALLLILLVSPVLYFGLFRFLIQQLQERQRILQELEIHRNHLEELVAERTKDLSFANDRLSKEVQQRESAQREILLKTQELSESVRQLNCLYSISKLLGNPEFSFPELMQRVVALIPAGLRSPDSACVKIQIDQMEFKTPYYKDTRWKLTRNINIFDERIGNLETCYLPANSEHDEKGFREAEKNLINSIADQLENAALLHKKGENLREALVVSCRYRDEVSALLESARAILKNTGFEAAARIIFDGCKNLIGASAGYVALLKKRGTENEVLFLEPGGDVCTVDPALPMPIRGLRAEAYSKGTAVYENNFKKSPWFKLLPAGHVGMNNVLFAPMIIDGRAAGVIGLANKPEGFDENDLRIATAFGELAAVAFLNSRTLESLQNSEERFRSVVATASEGIIVIDSRAQIQFWNKGAGNIFGYGADEVIGRNIDFIIPKRFRNAHQSALRSATVKEQSRLASKTLNMTGIRKDGTEFPLELSLANWKANNEVFFTSVIRDVTQRKQAEEALNRLNLELEERVKSRTAELNKEIEERKIAERQIRESKAMLQAVFDGISDPLILVDKNMRIKMLNKKAAKYYGISDYKKTVGKICHEATGKSELCNDCRIPEAASKGHYISFERESFANQGAVEQVVVYPVEEKAGDSGDAIIRITDITEAKQFERRLIQSEKMASLGILVSSIAHEINNPNNFVSFNIPILRDYVNEIIPYIDIYAAKHSDLKIGNMLYSEFRLDIFKLLDNIENGSRRISTFVANLRQYSQGGSIKAFSWLDLAVLIDKVLNIIQAEIKKSAVVFKKSICTQLPEIYSDPHAIEQILINLLINACHAVDGKNSRIDLTVMRDDEKGGVVVEIADNGCGMDEDTMLKIFDPFFTTKVVPKGTGLGLYVCHNLISGIGGHIKVESEPGKGSTFRVMLPGTKQQMDVK